MAPASGRGAGMVAECPLIEAMRDTVFASSFRGSRPRPSGLMGNRRGRARPGGPAKALESVGASWSAVSGEESLTCVEKIGTASVAEDGGESSACRNVASGPSSTSTLEVLDAAIGALDAGETNVARAQLLGLAAVFRAGATLPGETSFEAAKSGLDQGSGEV